MQPSGLSTSSLGGSSDTSSAPSGAQDERLRTADRTGLAASSSSFESSASSRSSSGSSSSASSSAADSSNTPSSSAEPSEPASERADEPAIESVPDQPAISDLVTRDSVLSMPRDREAHSFALADDQDAPALPPEQLDAISRAAQAIDEVSFACSYVLVDLQTGRGISGNADEALYTASSFKAPLTFFLIQG
ncbi:MAG: hypothetical protein IJ131_04155, partial [Eggerthellaceae bacterium]|nr:hypothetical protein [Eggerthellaceae bacterium]